MILRDRSKRDRKWKQYTDIVMLEDQVYTNVNITMDKNPDMDRKSKSNISSSESSRPTLIVRNEEIVIVTLVFIIWVSVILIFINRWGRIRMLEPYLPDYKSPSLPSLSPILPKRSSRISINIEPPSAGNHISRQIAEIDFEPKMFSSQMYLNRMCGGTSCAISAAIPARPRGNSVISGSSACMLAVEGFNKTRKTRSVENLRNNVSVKTSISTDI